MFILFIACDGLRITITPHMPAREGEPSILLPISFTLCDDGNKDQASVPVRRLSPH